MVNGLNPEKAKPSVRVGRKAASLCSKMAELPKDQSLVSSALLFFRSRKSELRRGDYLWKK